MHLRVSSSKRGFNTQEKKIDVCQECALKIGILKLTQEDKKANLSAADDLYNIISDIVQDSMCN